MKEYASAMGGYGECYWFFSKSGFMRELEAKRGDEVVLIDLESMYASS